MKPTDARSFVALVIGTVAVEEVFRHIVAGTSIVATILSSGQFSLQLVVACIFLLLRLFVILLLPALVIVRITGWFWPKAKQEPPGDHRIQRAVPSSSLPKLS